MARKTTNVPELAKLDHEDRAGLEWQEAAERAWADALEAAGGDAEAALGKWAPPPFPEWDKPELVRREVLGAYLVDPTAGVVHRVAGARESCRLDSLNPAVFVHFWHEVLEHYPDAKPHGCVTA